MKLQVNVPVTLSDTVSLVSVSLPLKLKKIQNIPSLSDSLVPQTSQQTYVRGQNSHRLANQPQAQPDWLTEQGSFLSLGSTQISVPVLLVLSVPQAHSSTVVVSMLPTKLHSGYTRSELKNWQWYGTIHWISAGYIIHNITSSADIVSVTALLVSLYPHFMLTCIQLQTHKMSKFKTRFLTCWFLLLGQ